MSAFETLKKDHKEVASLLDKLAAKSQRGSSRESLFNKLKTELEIHSLIEERCLYPALADVDETSALVEESIEEHDTVKELLGKLDTLSKDTDEWSETLKELKSNVEHHVREEESKLFPTAARVLSEEELEELEEEIEAERDEIETEASA